jgi:[ribosomal protein S5]-alanine N-acetyltransferase
MLSTTRLKLVPASLAHVRAEIADHERFAQMLQATVPADWPPESAADALPLFLGWLEAAPEQAGWFGWYALLLESGAKPPTLVGGGGFLGPPVHGEVQIGYSMLPQFQQRGIATEMVAGLVGWALDHPEVTHIVAETEWENPASVQVLRKIGFTSVGTTNTAGGMRFELRRATGQSMR